MKTFYDRTLPQTAQAKIFHNVFKQPKYFTLKARCAAWCHAGKGLERKQAEAKKELGRRSRHLFVSGNRMHRHIWYRVAVTCGLLPEGLEDFLSLDVIQQRQIITIEQDRQRTAGEEPWFLLKPAGNYMRSCKCSALFYHDVCFDEDRYYSVGTILWEFVFCGILY